MRRAAVLGAPIAHSLSPVLHRAAYSALGLDWTYEAIECDEQRLPALLRTLDDSWAGLSLTMPLKRTVFPLLDEVSDLARAVGGVNTVVFDDGRSLGDNTDVGGMLDALGELGETGELGKPGEPGESGEHGGQANSGAAALRSGLRPAVVLGAGATACSTLAALRELDVSDVAVVVRDPARTGDVRAVADRLGTTLCVRTLRELDTLLPADLVVSTLPSGAANQVADLIANASPATLLDVCYDPWPTPLAQAAADAGWSVVGGFALLLHQAARQVRLMTGASDVPVEVMRTAGESALATRTSSRFSSDAGA